MSRSLYGSEEKESFGPGYINAEYILSDREPGLFSLVETAAQFKHKSDYAFYADRANGLIYMVDTKRSTLICRFTKELFADTSMLPMAIGQFITKQNPL